MVHLGSARCMSNLLISLASLKQTDTCVQVFWFHLNWNQMFSNWKKISLVMLNILILCITLFMNTAGMYASIDSLLKIFADPDNEVNGPFTCADNSIF